MDHSRSIVLIGFIGSGKSTVGQLLSTRLQWPLVEVDAMIEEQLKMPISRIFSTLGEERFREEESAVLQFLAPTRRSIIVTGGGAVLRKPNLIKLRQLGTVVCLTCDTSNLGKRLLPQSNRPLLQTDDPGATIAQLLEKRAPLYREAADLTIDTSSLHPAQVADSILDALTRLN